MEKFVAQLETLTCPSCLQKIEAAVKRLDGVVEDSVNVLFNASKVRLEFDAQKLGSTTIVSAIENLGYDVIKYSSKAL